MTITAMIIVDNVVVVVEVTSGSLAITTIATTATILLPV